MDQLSLRSLSRQDTLGEAGILKRASWSLEELDRWEGKAFAPKAQGQWNRKGADRVGWSEVLLSQGSKNGAGVKGRGNGVAGAS